MLMEFALRPYVTAGVAVAGAGLIAAAPVGQPALDIQIRAVQLASVDAVADLTAGQEFPVSTWADVATNTLSNLEQIGPQIAQDPTPVLSAIEANQLEYASVFATGAEQSGTNLVHALQDFSTVVANAASDVSSGDVFDADQLISQYLTQAPLSVIRPLENAYFDVSQSITNNLDNVLNDTGNVYTNATAGLTSTIGSGFGGGSIPAWFAELQQAQLLPGHAAEVAFAGVSQDIVNALQSNNDTLAFNDLLNAPSTVIDAYLNGYNLDDGASRFVSPTFDAAAVMRVVAAEGLLSPRGTVETSRAALEAVAREISSPERAKEALDAVNATAMASSTADLNNLVADVASWLNPDTPLGELASLFDPNAVTDLTALLTSLF
jgi:hypothetical protein